MTILNHIRDDAVVSPFHPLKDMPAEANKVKWVCTDPQTLALQFNDDEAVWRSFESLRLSRRILRKLCFISEENLDHADWLEAERTRPVRAIGIPFNQT